MNIHFIRPEWLWLFPVIGIWLYWQWRSHRQQGWYTLLPDAITQYLVLGSSGVRQGWPWLMTLILSLTLVALAGPSIKKAQITAMQGGNARVLVMDMSMSMRATDAKPDRLHIARYKALDLLKSWRGGETGLVAFAGGGFTISPISTDEATVANLVPYLKPSIMPQQGSDLAAGVAQAIKLLEQSGYQHGDIVVIGDSTPIDQQAKITELLKKYHYRFSFLAVGSQSGAPIPLANGQLLKDNRGNIVIASVHLNAVAPLCRATNGLCQWVQPSDSDISNLAHLSALNHQVHGRDALSSQRQWLDSGYWLILPVLLLWLWRFRQLPMLTLALCVAMMGTIPKAQASLWLNQSQSANQAFHEHHYQQAAKLFEDPQWQASAWYKTGDYQQALQLFEKDDSAQGWYNRGNAYAHLGKYQDAIHAYNKALAKDAKLSDAVHNKQLIESLLKQRQKQQSSKNDQSSSKTPPQPHKGKSSSSNKDPQAKSSSGQRSSETDSSSKETKDHSSPARHSGTPTEPNKAAEQSMSNTRDTNHDDSSHPNKPSSASQDQGLAQQKSSAVQNAATEKSAPNYADKKQLQHWMEQIPNDPSLLLKNQLQLDYQQQHHHSSSEENW
ncbi:VWA domain-containing protein [Celerinatantimonas yamalensis]|uniref:VWA domain-containing protein n=1 Tax=Celerinatantimonas yamalensis TaxID=559956 RepID=A0ABW9G1P7_9GAMM